MTYSTRTWKVLNLPPQAFNQDSFIRPRLSWLHYPPLCPILARLLTIEMPLLGMLTQCIVSWNDTNNNTDTNIDTHIDTSKVRTRPHTYTYTPRGMDVLLPTRISRYRTLSNPFITDVSIPSAAAENVVTLFRLYETFTFYDVKNQIVWFIINKFGII